MEQEYADVYLKFDRAYNNGSLSQQMQQYPRRCCPHHGKFATTDRLLWDTGSFHSTRPYAGRPFNMRTFVMEETVLLRPICSLSNSTQVVVAAHSGLECSLYFKDIPLPYPEGTVSNRRRLFLS
ncbi:hypothetical protein TNIN_393571 [Trichonephila inaurata madagascariensis]|uniref:Uncharacterized protein n=1 Tax=Trichonephila inaurata madagascariensis TaxID=2747483 RepID=A0A8X6XVC0_9ARAC|nr:hypothetical protein TNIN_393571 [Trichonephila inaurata madagascariensis]